MTTRGHVYPKSVWKKRVWDRGWSLEDTYWCLEARLHREPDLLIRICPNPRYLIWWSLSNKYPGTIRMCEVMAKILSHASLLKCDDVRLKRLPRGNRICSQRNLYVMEDIFHITMQCSGTQQLRAAMFDEFEQHPDVREILTRYEHEIMPICLGKYPNDCDLDAMEKLWHISGKHISGINKYVLNQR